MLILWQTIKRFLSKLSFDYPKIQKGHREKTTNNKLKNITPK